MRIGFAILISVFLTTLIACKNSEREIEATVATNAGMEVSPPRARAGALDLSNFDFDRTPVVNLDGDWEFYWSALLAPNDFQTLARSAAGDADRDRATANPAYRAVPLVWDPVPEDSTNVQPDGVATYRLNIQLPPGKRFALKLLDQSSAFRIFANGEEVYASGIVGATEDAYTPLLKPGIAPLDLEPNQTELELILQVANFDHQSGGTWEPIRLGLREAVIAERERALAFALFLFGSLSIVGLYHLGLFALRSKDRTALYFGLVCLLLGARVLVTGERFLIHLFPEAGYDFYLRLEYLAYFASVPTFVQFWRSLFPKEMPRLFVQASVAVAVLCSLLTIGPTRYFSELALPYNIWAVLLSVGGLVSVIFSIARGRSGARIFLLGFVVLFATLINDVLYNSQIIYTFQLTPFGVFVFIFSQAYLLSMRFSSAFHEVEVLSDRLESRVEERTLELRQEQELTEKARAAMESLNSFSRLVNATVELDEVIDYGVAYLRARHDIESIWLQFVDREKNELYTYNTFGEDRPDVQRFYQELRIPLVPESGTVYRTYIRKRPFYLSRVGNAFPSDYDRRIVNQGGGLQSLLQIPLEVQDEVIAMLHLTSFERPLHFSRSDIQSIAHFGAQMATAIHNSTLVARAATEQQAAEAARQELSNLHEFSLSINATAELESVLKDILAYATGEFQIEGLLLMLMDSEKESLNYYWTNEMGFHTDEIREHVHNMTIPMAPEGGWAYQVARRKRYSYMPKIQIGRVREEDPVQKMAKIAGIRSALIYPLIAEGEVIGLFFFSNYHNPMLLSRANIEAIGRMCNQVAGAVRTSALMSAVHAEREKSDRLLRNILPDTIAAELKDKGYVKPSLYESVTILFTDFKGFTRFAADMAPRELVEELDRIFLQFDRIVERHGIEKLKTIGDAYMCVGGLPERNESHALDVCLAALEILNFMNETRRIKKEFAGEEFWELRIGIHSGPVVAGVIGKNKFAYDIWGDAVNTASRMESSGVAGAINISAETRSIVEPYFECEYRGKIAAKNKGELEMYFLKRLKPEFSRDADGLLPNDAFSAQRRSPA
ncbi:MAG: GAF domain-containing protein [bacterium]|nr:GAF domain-containing protein [bacterium]